MLRIQGLLQNVYIKPQTINKGTGEVQPARLYMQVMGEFPLGDGGTKLEMRDIKADLALHDHIQKLLGKIITAPVSIFTPKNSQAIYISVGVGVLPEIFKPATYESTTKIVDESKNDNDTEENDNLVLLKQHIKDKNLSSLSVGVANTTLNIETTQDEIKEAFKLLKAS